MTIGLTAHSSGLHEAQISSFRAASERLKTPFPPRECKGPTPPSIAIDLARGRGGVPSARFGAQPASRAPAHRAGVASRRPVAVHGRAQARRSGAVQGCGGSGWRVQPGALQGRGPRHLTPWAQPAYHWAVAVQQRTGLASRKTGAAAARLIKSRRLFSCTCCARMVRLWRAVWGGGNPCRFLFPVRQPCTVCRPFLA